MFHDTILGLVQGRLTRFPGKNSGYIESLPDYAFKGVQAEQFADSVQAPVSRAQKKRSVVRLSAFVTFLFLSSTTPTPTLQS
jgi:hypothetical protein